MQIVQYEPNDIHVVTANAGLLKIRKILGECDQIGPEVAYTVLVSLVADSVMLAPNPDEWFQELVDSVQQCRQMKLQALLQESATSSHH